MRTPWPTVVALALLAPLGLHAPLHAQSTPAQARVVVKFKADAPLLRQRALSGANASSVSADRASVLGTRVGVALRGGAMVSTQAQTVTATGIHSAELARRLAAQPDVEYAEPVVKHRRTGVANDPRYAGGQAVITPAVGQWYLRPPTSTVRAAINAETAWDITTGSSSVVVAVLDTGVRFDHADLLRVSSGGNLLDGYDMVSQDATNVFATAGDGNGRDADASDPGDYVSSADVATGYFDDCLIEDSSWHGTQTASLVGAVTDNNIGMASVGRNVRVLPVRVLGKCGGFTDDIAAGIRWAAGIPITGVPPNPNPAHIINMSLGGSGACSATYQDAINEAVAAGVLVVVSAGNSDGHAVSSPANCNGALAVTGLRHIGTKVGFADVGTEAAIAAPAGNCVSTSGNTCLYPIITATNSGTTTPAGSTYTDGLANPAYGTSFAAPLVAGTAALMLSVQSNMTPAQLRAALQGSARTFPTDGADAGTLACRAPTGANQSECYCTTSTCGAGMLDAHGAVLAASRGLQARVTTSTATPRAAQAVTLSAASSFVAGVRSIASYQWTLVDGGGIVTTLDNPTASAVTVTPSAAGRFTVSLTVTDDSTPTPVTSTSVQAVDVTAQPLVSTGDGGGGGGVGLAWLAGLALAVLTLQFQLIRQARERRSLQKLPPGRR